MNEHNTESAAETARPTPPKRAVIYLRVASRRPEDQAAIHAQREACEQLARKYELAVVREYVDLGRSGRALDRPGLRRLLDNLTGTAGIGYVIVESAARLSRSPKLLRELMTALHASGARLLIADTGGSLGQNGLLSLIKLTIAEAYGRNRMEARR